MYISVRKQGKAVILHFNKSPTPFFFFFLQDIALPFGLVSILLIFFFFFNSPEHKVLIVSFCDRPMSGVRRLLCIIYNFFKHLLLLNHWVNLDETWQRCSLGEALLKLFKRLNSIYNSGCHGNQKEKKKIAKSLKIFFSETRRHGALIFGM